MINKLPQPHVPDQQRRRQPVRQAIFRLVWLILVVVVAAVHITSTPLQIEVTLELGWPEWSAAETQAAWAELPGGVQALVGLFSGVNIVLGWIYLFIALFLFWRRPSDKVAVLVASFFLLFFSGSNLHLLSKNYPGIAQAGHFMDVVVTILSFTIFFIFPDGEFKPRWTRWAFLYVVAVQAWRLINNDAYQSMFLLLGGLPFLLIGAAQLQRYRRHSTPSQRRQVKWVVFGLIASSGTLGLYIIALLSVPELREPSASGILVSLAGHMLWFGFMIMFPATLLIAIFKSQLWDIDLVIRRTLIYGAITFLLGGVYLGAVTILQSLFTSTSGQSSKLSVVLSTLAIAALFNPLRSRIQDVIDRHFFRQKYNAELALEKFAASAQMETNLDELGSQILKTVQETIQPEQTSLWLAGSKTPKEAALDR
jgi:hypothetical protein